MTIREKYNIIDPEYYNCIKDLIETEVVQDMDKYIQHGSTTTLDHSIAVSYLAYRLARKLDLDYISVARAGLLHDFYLYDWHELPKEKKLFKKHGFTHSKKALENASKYFELNEVEKDIIVKHMWPLTLRQIPKYKETTLVSFADKVISSKETVSPYLVELKNMI